MGKNERILVYVHLCLSTSIISDNLQVSNRLKHIVMNARGYIGPTSFLISASDVGTAVSNKIETAVCLIKCEIKFV